MSTRVLFYSLYERIWHWAQALGIMLLLLSGFQIHYPDSFPLFGSMANAVNLHRIIGFILLANALMGFLYTMTTNKLREFVPMPLDFTRGAFEQGNYYLKGIFRGDPHPYEKSPHKKLNPLQKITYFFLLNLFLPFQLITGVLLWGSTYFTGLFDRLGGLSVLAPLHTLGAYFFLAFLIIHIYLATTGRTPLEYIRQMVSGYGEAGEEHAQARK